MATYKKEGKDVIIFASAEDHRQPSKVILPDPEPQQGPILPNGEINWNCPCLGGMATGPCGLEFREAFSCYHNSQADPKGSDCYDAFKEMHLCMAEYPQVYMRDEDKDSDFDLDEEELMEENEAHKKLEPESKTVSGTPSSEPSTTKAQVTTSL